MSSEYLHLINDECQLMPGLNNFIEKSGLKNSHTDYNIVSIIGSQNSGKSTLLNRVFGTNFQMLQGSSKTQTTKGIWMSRDKEKDIIILDVEGSNSRQRGKAEKGSEFFERSTALFALAFSQILIINCNSMNLGHESEYNIIKIIMEMNLRLFKCDQVKQMLIVVRDFNEETDDFQAVCNGIRSEIYGIWNEVTKPAEYANATPEAIFNIQFFKSAHYQYQRDRFESEMLELRSRFTDKSNPNNLFAGYNYNTNIPIEALDDLSVALWTTIQKNEDLNLPNQKLQASQVRCLRIKTQAIELISKDLQSLKQNAEKSYLKDFNTKSQDIVKNSLMHYDQESQYYVEQIRNEMRKTLNDELKQSLFPIFNQQIQSLNYLIKNQVNDMLYALQKSSPLFTDFIEKAQSKFEEIDMLISQGIYESLPYNDYKEEWEISKIEKQFRETAREIVNNEIENQFDKFLTSQEKSIKYSIESLVSNSFEDLSLEFWNNVRDNFKTILYEVEAKVRKNIMKYMSHDRIEQEIQKLHSTGHSFLLEEVQKKVREMPYYLMKKFKRIFVKNEKNITRQWKQMEEVQIQELYMESRKTVEGILQEFSRFKIVDDSKQQIYLQRVANKFKSAIISRQKRDEVVEAQQVMDSENLKYPSLLDPAQLNKIKTQFMDESEEEYDQAIRLKTSSFSTNIPKWLWFVLAFFMYDDILRWMAEPLLLYPIILLGSFVGLCFATGYKQLPIALAKELTGGVKQIAAPVISKFQ